MPSDLQVSNIKDLTGSNTGLSIASDGQVTIAQNNPTVTLGSNTTFPDNMSYYVSAITRSSTDSGDVTLNTTYGFGTVNGPISLPNNVRIRMHIYGGLIEYDAGSSWGSAINYKTGSTFTNNNDGSFTDDVNWTNAQNTKLTSNYINADYSNTSGSSVNIYFRAGMRSTQSTTARWYASQGRITYWYELIQI